MSKRNNRKPVRAAAEMLRNLADIAAGDRAGSAPMIDRARRLADRLSSRGRPRRRCIQVGTGIFAAALAVSLGAAPGHADEGPDQNITSADYVRGFCAGARAVGTLDKRQAIAVTVTAADGDSTVFRCSPSEPGSGLPPVELRADDGY